MKKLVILGFLLLLGIDTLQQVTAKLAAINIGEPMPHVDWLFKVLNEPLVYAVLGLYCAAFVVYSWLLRIAPVGPSYAALHGHVVTVLLVSIFFFGERLTMIQVAGCGLIVAGIIVLAVTEKVH